MGISSENDNNQKPAGKQGGKHSGKQQTAAEAFVPVEGAVKGTEMQTGSAKMNEKDLYIKDVAQKMMDTVAAMPMYIGNLSDLEMVQLAKVVDIVATTYVDIVLAKGELIDFFMNLPMTPENISKMLEEFLPILETKKDDIKAVIDKEFAQKMVSIYMASENETSETNQTNQAQGTSTVETITPTPAPAAAPKAAPVGDQAVLLAYFARYVAPSQNFKDKETEAKAAAQYYLSKQNDKRFILWAADFMDMLDNYSPSVHGNSFVAKEVKETTADTWTDNIFTAIIKEVPKTPGRIYQDVMNWWDGVHVFA